MIRPRWEWSLTDHDGHRLDPSLSPVFTAQYDAEQWLGEHWRQLAGSGAEAATLLHDGTQATPTIELRVP
ncbi:MULTISPECIES: hypothetical protein [Isoptericola]|uniref:hypothetical protein n=1 Tax=Isoptericola TaxID=254250 RepID=UPI00383B27D0